MLFRFRPDYREQVVWDFKRCLGGVENGPPFLGDWDAILRLRPKTEGKHYGTLDAGNWLRGQPFSEVATQRGLLFWNKPGMSHSIGLQTYNHIRWLVPG